PPHETGGASRFQRHVPRPHTPLASARPLSGHETHSSYSRARYSAPNRSNAACPSPNGAIASVLSSAVGLPSGKDSPTRPFSTPGSIPPAGGTYSNSLKSLTGTQPDCTKRSTPPQTRYQR